MPITAIQSPAPEQLDPHQLWYVPDRRLRTKIASDRAKSIAGTIDTASGFDAEPVEEELFAALHTCAFRAARRSGAKRIPMRERMMWAERWQVIRGRIVEKNLGLAYAMISRFGSRKLDEDDLLSDALFALTRAVDRFNPWRGYRFSTYACNVIARALMRRGKRESQYRRLFPVQHDISFERSDGAPERGTDLYVERLNRALDGNLGDLTDLESHILAHRFPSERQTRLTFQEIGDGVGLSKERVRQIQNIALRKLRDVLDQDPVLQ